MNYHRTTLDMHPRKPGFMTNFDAHKYHHYGASVAAYAGPGKIHIKMEPHDPEDRNQKGMFSLWHDNLSGDTSTVWRAWDAAKGPDFQP